jgi:hypothetical protein
MGDVRVLAASDFNLGSCQATVFTPEEEASASKVMRGLFPAWAGRFDGEPVILPNAEGFPREVPKLILQSKSQEWHCEIASARVNLFWRRQVNSKPIPVGEFADEAAAVLSDYIGFCQARVGRIAFIRTSYALHPDPGTFLARHFCQDRWKSAPLNRPASFELHSHKQFSLRDRWVVNSWVRSKSGRVAYGDTADAAVVVEQDLNTLAEDVDSRDFHSDEIRDFLSASAIESASILDLYYPTIKE